jgi:hypothetical protein
LTTCKSGRWLKALSRRQLIEISHKKPRKSKKNAHPALTAAQRAANHAVRYVRMFIEHAIGGMKRFNILVQRFHNRKEDLEDGSVGLCAGLRNLTYAIEEQP